MSTLTKPRAKKPARAVRKVPAAKRPLDTDPRFPGLVRSRVTGLLISPKRPGEKPIDSAVLKAALADSL
jgi:hypothetical protein